MPNQVHSRLAASFNKAVKRENFLIFRFTKCIFAKVSLFSIFVQVNFNSSHHLMINQENKDKITKPAGIVKVTYVLEICFPYC